MCRGPATDVSFSTELLFACKICLSAKIWHILFITIFEHSFHACLSRTIDLTASRSPLHVAVFDIGYKILLHHSFGTLEPMITTVHSCSSMPFTSGPRCLNISFTIPVGPPAFPEVLP